MSATTVRRSVFELEGGEEPFPPERVRRPGGGRKSVAEKDPELVAALLGLVEPDERGDPESRLRWTTKSLQHLATELTRQGHPVSAPTVGTLLACQGFSLQGTAKTLEGQQHPDRDAQFRYLNEQVKDHHEAGEPVISVDTKRREQLGALPNAGREYHRRGKPVAVGFVKATWPHLDGVIWPPTGWLVSRTSLGQVGVVGLVWLGCSKER